MFTNLMPLIICFLARAHARNSHPPPQASNGLLIAFDAIVLCIQVAAPERVSVDAYVIDSLLADLVGHDRRPAAFILFLFLWRKTRGGSQPAVLSLQMMTDG